MGGGDGGVQQGAGHTSDTPNVCLSVQSSPKEPNIYVDTKGQPTIYIKVCLTRVVCITIMPNQENSVHGHNTIDIPNVLDSAPANCGAKVSRKWGIDGRILVGSINPIHLWVRWLVLNGARCPFASSSAPSPPRATPPHPDHWGCKAPLDDRRASEVISTYATLCCAYSLPTLPHPTASRPGGSSNADRVARYLRAAFISVWSSQFS